MPDARWWCRWTSHREMHVLPHANLMDHEERGCICGPSAMEENNRWGRRVTVVLHHSLDGRERSHAS